MFYIEAGLFSARKEALDLIDIKQVQAAAHNVPAKKYMLKKSAPPKT